MSKSDYIYTKKNRRNKPLFEQYICSQLHSWNQTDVLYPQNKTLQQLFEAQVTQTPDNIALIFENKRMTYNELNKRANQLVHVIRDRYQQRYGFALKPDTLIALYFNRGIEMVVSILAVLKAGAAYVPISSEYPQERTKFILKDTQAKVLLTQECHFAKLENWISQSDFIQELIDVNNHTVIDGYTINRIEHASEANDLAYVIYTSGTAGKPKGVMIEHRSVANLISGQKDVFDFSANEIVLWLPAYIFDASIEPLFLTLFNGACLILPTDEEVKQPEQLKKYLIKNNITHLVATPSHLLLLGDVSEEVKRKVKRVVFGGETCPPSLKAIWKDKLINEYGPTESTVTAAVSTDYYFQESAQCIGRPIQNTRFYVLDDDHNLAPIGTQGELYIGGAGLARGYLNNSELTEKHFIDNVFATPSDIAKGYTRIYKTNDLVCWLPDGNLEFIGRDDHQVKIRGHRVELGEIEQALTRLPDVKQAIVIDFTRSDTKSLIAYIISVSGVPLAADTLRQALVAELPEYMVPVSFIHIDALPLTINSKLDRKGLPEPVFVTDEDYVAPRNDLESRLCAIWQDVLGLPLVGIYNNFFRIGGDSIMSILLVSKLSQAGFKLQVKTLVDAPTIEKIAVELSNSQTSADINIVVEQGVLQGEFDLLPTQQYFFDSPLAQSHYWNQAFMVRLPGDITIDVIETAIEQLTEQHDMLRCHFILGEDGYQQRYDMTMMTPFKHLDISTLDNSALRQQLSAFQSEFDYHQGPLWNAVYLHGYDDGSARLWFAAHHLIIDVVSWRIIADDLRLLFTGQSLASKGSSYRQWVRAVQEYAVKHPQERDYWQGVVEHQPLLPDLESVSTHKVSLSAEQTTRLLHEANQGYHTEINDLLFSALAIALQETFDRPTNHITVEGHGRESIDLSLDITRTLGWFTSVYPIRLNTSSTIEDTIISTKESLRNIPNKGLGFGALYQTGKLSCDLPAISFNYLEQLDKNNTSEDWLLVNEDCGRINSPDNGDDLLLIGTGNGDQLVLNINGTVQQGVLTFNVVSRLSLQCSQQFVNAFTTALLAVTEQGCYAALLGGKKTPSDYHVPKLSISHLARLEQTYKVEDLYPASGLQQGFIYHHLSQPQDDAYLVQQLIDYRDALDIKLYKQAWGLASLRYPVLRTAFNWDHAIIQVITSGQSINELNFDYVDLSESIAADRDDAITVIQQQDRAIAFDLSQPGLIRLTLIKQADNFYTVLQSVHHSIADGWSGQLLLRSVHQYYDALKQGGIPVVNPEVTYLEAQKYLLEQQQSVEEYWSEIKQGFDDPNDISFLLSRPVDFSKPHVVTKPANKALILDGDNFLNLKTMCQTLGVTVNVALQFAWHKLLHIYTQDEQTIVGTTVLGRSIPIDDIESSVGLYINTLPLSVNWGEQVLTSNMLNTIQQDIAVLNTYSSIPLTSLQSNGQRLFHSILNFERYPESNNDLDNSLCAKMQMRDTIEKIDYLLAVTACEYDESLTVTLNYSEEWLHTERAISLLHQLNLILTHISKYPEEAHKKIPLLSNEDRHMLLHEWNQTDAPYPQSKTIHQLFEEQVERTPDKAALIFEDEELTYGELNIRANQLSHVIRQQYQQLHQKPIQADTLIVLYLDRSLETVISILAVLKSGGAYVPISPEYPAERTKFILEDTRAELLLTQQHHVHSLNVQLNELSNLLTMLVVDKPDTTAGRSTDNLDAVSTATDLAYIIYTSGTTGQPKGVQIEHKAVCSFSINNTYLKPSKTNNVASMSSHAFDGFIFDVFFTMLNGKTLHLVSKQIQLEPSLLLEFIVGYSIDSFFTTTALFNSLTLSGIFKGSGLKTILFGGEAVDPIVVGSLMTDATDIDLVHVYGPTETTVFATACHLNSELSGVPIGSALTNKKLYVLDLAGNPVPIGVPGELYIGGAGLARGYLNRPDLTHKQFITNPFACKSDIEKGYTRLYKTGDIVRWQPDGNLEYIGRNDCQVKIRGYRIELGEIESALLTIDGIKQAVVLDHKHEGKNFLMAYLVTDSTQAPQVNSIREVLASQLPDYMIPATFIFIDKVPLTVNGKLDRKALPEPKFVDTDTYVAPSTELESQLCDIWQAVMGIERVGIEDNFFQIGGDSIVSIQLVTQMRRDAISVQVKDIFDAPTVSQLAALLGHSRDEVVIRAEQGVLTGGFKLLPIQTWFFEQNHRVPNHWNQAFMVRVPHHISTSEIEQAVQRLVEQHDMLRVVFTCHENEIRQHYLDSADKTMAVMSAVNLKSCDESELYELMTQWQSDFDVEQGPLWRAAHLTGCEDSQASVWFAFHHLIIDVVSWRIIAEDLEQLLTGHLLTDKTSSYRQWVDTVYAYPQPHQSERNYWQQVLSDMTIFSESELSALQTYVISLTSYSTEQLLHQANGAYHTEINDVLLSALTIALQTTFERDVFHIILEGHGRETIDHSIDVSRTVGWFTTLYPIRLTGQPSLKETLVHTKEMLRAIPEKGIGFGSCYSAGDDGEYVSLPAISFNYLGQLDTQVFKSDGLWQLMGGATGEQVASQNVSELLLNINGVVRQGKLTFCVDSRLPSSITAHFNIAFERALNEIIAHCCEATLAGRITTPADHSHVTLTISQLEVLQSKYDIEELYPANSLQQGFIYHHLHQPNDDAYRVQLLFDIYHELNIELYQQAWSLASLCYPILRTAFDWDGEMLQVITKGISITSDNFSLIDLSHMTENERNAEIELIQQQDRTIGFDFSQPGLIRFTLIKHHNSHYTLLKSEHHSISDGWSIPVLMQTVLDYYQTLLKGNTPIIKVDTAYPAAQAYQTQHTEQANLYWNKKKTLFGHANDINTLLSHTIDLSQVNAIETPAEQVLTIEGDAYVRLKQFCRQLGITINVVTQFAWHKLLHSYTQDDQTIVGTTVSGRDIPVEGIDYSVGLYINTLPLAVNWSNDVSIISMLKSIQQGISELNNYSNVSLAGLQHQGERLFHNLFVFENYPMSANKVDQSETGNRVDICLRNAVEKSDYPLSIIAYEQDERLVIKLNYGEEWLTDAQASRLLSQMECIIVAATVKPDSPHQQISLVKEAELCILLYEWNQTDAPYPQNKTIHQLFEEQVERTPDKAALIFEDEELTYRELNIRANQLAHAIRQQYQQLHQKPIQADTLIALYLDRSLETVISILAVLKSGGAYVPISPEYPAQRTQFIMEDISTGLIITQQHHVATLYTQLSALSSIPGILLAEQQDATLEQSTDNLNTYSTETDLAYVIYTSGTTGQPKGVMIQHNNVCHLISALIDKFCVQSIEKSLLFSSFVFDASVFELFISLYCGHTLYLCSDNIRKDYIELEYFIEKNAIELATIPPAILSVMSTERLTSLKTLIVVGESPTKDTMDRFSRQTALYNAYGPTESTVCVSANHYVNSLTNNIGSPINNTQLFILDSQLNVLPTGVPGELYIGGAGLARGYLNRPELTRERFIANPFASESDIEKGYTKLYKTGDIVRRQPDGNLEYIGRNDSQVKIRGYRIELEEIEYALTLLPHIKQAVVISHDHSNGGGKYLSAYVVSESGGLSSVDELKLALSTKLPDYMVPTNIIPIDFVPLTANGKLDKYALPEPELVNEINYVAPRNVWEMKLCDIWQDVLCQKQIGIDDNFFSIGGNSISLIKVSTLCSKENMNLVPKILVKHSTIRALSEYLEEAQPENLSELSGKKLIKAILNSKIFEKAITINSNCDDAGLFLIPAAGGQETFGKLVDKIRLNRPVHLMENIKIYSGRFIILTTLVDYYYQAIRIIQPEGPYYLGGFCEGAVIALEVAKQLKEAGESVLMTFMIDPIIVTVDEDKIREIRNDQRMLDDKYEGKEVVEAFIYLAEYQKNSRPYTGSCIFFETDSVNQESIPVKLLSVVDDYISIEKMYNDAFATPNNGFAKLLTNCEYINLEVSHDQILENNSSLTYIGEKMSMVLNT